MQNIILVGFMGTGKTAVANNLAHKTGMPLLDTDTIIEQRAGKPITAIFAEDGEPAFRVLENQVAAELAQPSGSIISTGGGIVKNPENIKLLEKGGLVFCLQASVDEILRRVADDTTRPLLHTPDRRVKIESLLTERAPLYAAIPHQIQTDNKTIEQVADEILTTYNKG